MLTSTQHEFQRPVSVTFDYLLQKSRPGSGGSLSVYLLTEQDVPTRLRFTELRSDLTGGWMKGCVYIPRGTYKVMFVATVGLPYHSDVYIDNVKLASDWCCQENDINPGGNLIFHFWKLNVNFIVNV